MPSNLYAEYPELDGVPASLMSRIIIEARLSQRDVHIAAARLVWGMDYADIAAAVHMDRTAVADRLRNQIMPRLTLVVPYVLDGCARAM